MNRPLSALVLALTCLSAIPSARAQEQAAVGIPTARMAPRESFPAQLFGSCTGEIAPSMVLIAGGVAVQGLKPLDTSGELDKQMAAIAKYIDENHGKLVLLERVRTLKNPAFNGSSDTGPPFEIVQRLHVELPVSAPVDAVLQRLLELGLDRFGETVLATNNRREEAVLFRIGNLDSALHEMEHRCIEDAWKKWCATDPPTIFCKSDAPPSNFQLANFSARSDEEVLLPGTGAGYCWQVTLTRGQDAQPPRDLLGNITLHLTGTIFLNFSYPREEKP
jgi:hypothetical protein